MLGTPVSAEQRPPGLRTSLFRPLLSPIFRLDALSAHEKRTPSHHVVAGDPIRSRATLHIREIELETSRLLGNGCSTSSTTPSRTFAAHTATENELTEFLRARCAQIDLERATESVSGQQANWSVRHPWLRNLLYFGPSLGAIAGGIAQAVIAPDEPFAYSCLIAAGTLWGIGSCFHLRADKRFAETHYGGDFRYC